MCESEGIALVWVHERANTNTVSLKGIIIICAYLLDHLLSCLQTADCQEVNVSLDVKNPKLLSNACPKLKFFVTNRDCTF